MRILIDGYNLMFEAGLLDKSRKLGPKGLRKARRRFLEELADRLGPVDAHQTTVVFDASHAPADLPTGAAHKGIGVDFADDADERIEQLVAAHSHARDLTVVSTDHRVRRAAERRKARALTADAFWTKIETQRRRRPPEPNVPERPGPLSAEESAFWVHEFQEVEQMPEAREALAPDSSMLTDEEIAELEREVDREFS